MILFEGHFGALNYETICRYDYFILIQLSSFPRIAIHVMSRYASFTESIGFDSQKNEY